MGRYAKTLTDAFAFAYMLMLSTGIYFLFSTISVNSADILSKSGDSAIYQYIWFLLYIVLGLQCFLIRKELIPHLSRNLLPLFLILEGAVGYINGAHPESEQHLAMYAFTFLFAQWAATYYTPDRVFDLFFKLGKVLLIEYWAIYPIFSKYTLLYDKIERVGVLGLKPYAGTFAHKNLAGGFFAICAIIGLMKLLDRSQKRSVVDMLFVGAMIISVMATGAINPLLCVTAVCLFIPFVRLWRKNWAVAGLYATVILVGGMFIFLSAGAILGLFGRDLGFTGRSFLVTAWPHFFFRHPLFGYGFGEFFADSPSSGGMELLAISPPWHTYMNFESSYLQIGIDFGAVGMAIVMAILLRNLWIEFGILQRSNSPMAALPFVLTLYLIFSSFSDIYLALHNCYIPFLLFYIYAIGRRERAQARLWRPDPRLGWAAARGALSLNRYS